MAVRGTDPRGGILLFTDRALLDGGDLTRISVISAPEIKSPARELESLPKCPHLACSPAWQWGPGIFYKRRE
ncbi:unnamed protein product [Protopolystoma xenopodis]|uniref:Uncharacterized protein n=1 Tax=Protopolystoma xenopodis TaxID=117903 RepID=A0A3S5B385_9PLAT|nr:unnamed protein product [Protopolystoma xenopodis]